MIIFPFGIISSNELIESNRGNKNNKNLDAIFQKINEIKLQENYCHFKEELNNLNQKLKDAQKAIEKKIKSEIKGLNSSYHSLQLLNIIYNFLNKPINNEETNENKKSSIFGSIIKYVKSIMGSENKTFENYIIYYLKIMVESILIGDTIKKMEKNICNTIEYKNFLSDDIIKWELSEKEFYYLFIKELEYLNEKLYGKTKPG